MKLLVSAALLAAMFGVAGTGIDLAAAPPQAAVQVRVTFADDPAHKIASDLGGPYQDGQGVYAAIDAGSTGNLVMYSKASKTVPVRQFRLTFDDCIGICNAVPFVSSLTNAQLIAGVRQPGGTPHPGGMLTMPVGATGFRTGLKMYLGSINSVHWTLCQTPGDGDGFCANSNGSTPAHIVRATPDSWTIWANPGPDPGPSGPDLRDGGELFTEASTGRSKLITLQGEYAMPFSMTVQCVNASNCP